MSGETIASLSSAEMAQQYLDEHLDGFSEWAHFAAQNSRPFSDYHIWTNIMLAKFVLGR